MRPYLITAKLMRPSNMKRFPTPDLTYFTVVGFVKAVPVSVSSCVIFHFQAGDSVSLTSS
jgi:hypothetical protein